MIDLVDAVYGRGGAGPMPTHLSSQKVYLIAETVIMWGLDHIRTIT